MKRTICLATVLWLIASATGFAADRGTHIAVQGRDVAIWRPTTSAPASGYPVIMFSHGFGGCNTQSTFLMVALANAGYMVVAPNHADARCGTAGPRGIGRRRPDQPFGQPEQWSDATYRNRREDIEVILDWLATGKKAEGAPVDLNHVGIAGHSLGGYTALGLAGAWPSWRDDRIKAALALSAFCTPYTAKGDLKHLGIPVMYQGGTRDFGVTPAIKRFNGAYDLSSSPKYYVEFDGAGHFAWTDLNPRFQSIINRYSVAFFDRYLKSGPTDTLTPLLGAPFPSGVSSLKYSDSGRTQQASSVSR